MMFLEPYNGPFCGISWISDPHCPGQSRPFCLSSSSTPIVFVLHLAGKSAAFCQSSDNLIGLVLASGERALIPFSILRSDAVGFSFLHHLLCLSSSVPGVSGSIILRPLFCFTNQRDQSRAFKGPLVLSPLKEPLVYCNFLHEKFCGPKTQKLLQKKISFQFIDLKIICDGHGTQIFFFYFVDITSLEVPQNISCHISKKWLRYDCLK